MVAVYNVSYNADGSVTATTGNWAGSVSTATYYYPASTPIAPAAIPASTGVSPQETQYSLYGHPIPLSVFGVGRIGGEIIAGPWVENGLASFIISFGVPADPSGTRDLREIAFDSEVVWTAAGGFTVEAFTYRFYGGTLTQAADTLETTHFGVQANAYRPQMLLAFSNLPLASTKFRKIPYVSAVIGDASGDDVNFGEMFERLAYSPWVGWTSAQFDTSGITDGVTGGGLIIAQESQFLQLLQQFGRFYPKWDILQTDKLRIRDRGDDIDFDVELDKTSLTGPLVMSRAEPNSVPKVLELSTIDPDADYTIVPSRAQTPVAPVAVSTSVKTESAYLPVIMDASTRASVVTYTKYHEEIIRKKISFTAMAFGLEIEPGDYVAITGLGEDFRDEIFRVIETLHGANYVVEITAESILRCDTSGDPYLSRVVLLLGFEGADGSKGAPGFTDESPRQHGTAHATNSVQIDTSQSKFGTASGLITGLSPFVSFPASQDWRLSVTNSDQFTIEAFVRLNGFGTPYGCIVAWNLLGVTWDFSTLPTHEFRFRFVTIPGVEVQVASSGAALTTGVWYHLAVDKDATGKIRVYKDGVMMGSATPADSSMYDSTPTAQLQIGSAGLFGGASLDGWIDEIRITKGLARYASDSGFAVPTAAFPRE